MQIIEIDISNEQRNYGTEISEKIDIKNTNNCKICVVDDSFPNFELDKDGICNYCNHFEMEKDMPNDHRDGIINKKVK